jgi:hypothetical protein
MTTTPTTNPTKINAAMIMVSAVQHPLFHDHGSVDLARSR